MGHDLFLFFHVGIGWYWYQTKICQRYVPNGSWQQLGCIECKLAKKNTNWNLSRSKQGMMTNKTTMFGVWGRGQVISRLRYQGNWMVTIAKPWQTSNIGASLLLEFRAIPRGANPWYAAVKSRLNLPEELGDFRHSPWRVAIP